MGTNKSRPPPARLVEPELRIAYAGDRDIAVQVLDFLIAEAGVRPVALLLPGESRASHDGDLLARCTDVTPDRVIRGRSFTQPEVLQVLRSLRLDYLISVHFPYLFPSEVVRLPGRGCLNLHPAYLPYNRGWHTASWAVLDGTPLGATLHFMDDGADTGDIVHQMEVPVGPGDTAASLYPLLFQAELEVFREAWPSVAAGMCERRPQQPGDGSTHTRHELAERGGQRLGLDETLPVEHVFRRLRAFTTNRPDEACYYEVDGRRYRVQVTITEEAPPPF